MRQNLQKNMQKKAVSNILSASPIEIITSATAQLGSTVVIHCAKIMTMRDSTTISETLVVDYVSEDFYDIPLQFQHGLGK